MPILPDRAYEVLPQEEITQFQNRLHEAMRRIPAPPMLEGCGITICAGGIQYFTCAYVQVRLLRKHGCTLPVQFWHLGEHEFSAEMAALVAPYGVECIDASKIPGSEAALAGGGWPLKAFAALHCPFEEVIALDADNVPIMDPSYLLDDEDYAKTGSIFWPDRGRTPEAAAIWELMGVAYVDEPEFETGQMAINKTVCWKALNLAVWLNQEYETIYRFIYGDKDTFRFAWRKIGLHWAMPDLGVTELILSGGPTMGVMCQYDLQGDLIFQHRNFPKWSLHGPNPRVAGFLFETQCLTYLTELKRLWAGNLTVPETAPIELTAERKNLMSSVWLVSKDPPERAYRVIHPGDPATNLARIVQHFENDWASVEVRFEADGTLGTTVNAHFHRWKLWTDDTKDIILEISNDKGLSALFTRSVGNVWIGDRCGGFRLPEPTESFGMNSESQVSNKLRMERAVDKYPAVSDPPSSSACELNSPRKELHVRCSADGLGDAVTAFYACCGAARAGYNVKFYTDKADWFHRAHHDHVSVVKVTPSDGALDLNHDYHAQLHHGKVKAYWFSSRIDPSIVPTRPQVVDRENVTPVVLFDNYVVLAPFAAWSIREWPVAHWVRLCHLLGVAGLEVVVIGATADEARFKTAFATTYAFGLFGLTPTQLGDLLLGGKALVGNDSGPAHLGGLLGIPTIAIHSHLPPEFLWHCTSVVPITPETNCRFCRWKPDRGWNASCDEGCSALGTISPDAVVAKLQHLLITRTV